MILMLSRLLLLMEIPFIEANQCRGYNMEAGRCMVSLTCIDGITSGTARRFTSQLITMVDLRVFIWVILFRYGVLLGNPLLLVYNKYKSKLYYFLYKIYKRRNYTNNVII